jgi:hypothetical protein
MYDDTRMLKRWQRWQGWICSVAGVVKSVKCRFDAFEAGWRGREVLLGSGIRWYVL